MRKKIQVRKVVKTTTKSTGPSSGGPAEKLKVVYWVGAIVLVGVKIYLLLQGIG